MWAKHLIDTEWRTCWVCLNLNRKSQPIWPWKVPSLPKRNAALVLESSKWFVAHWNFSCSFENIFGAFMELETTLFFEEQLRWRCHSTFFLLFQYTGLAYIQKTQYKYMYFSTLVFIYNYTLAANNWALFKEIHFYWFPFLCIGVFLVMVCV